MHMRRKETRSKTVIAQQWIIFLAAKVKKVKTASIAYQQHFMTLIARWTVCCFRPFSISEDAEPQTAFDFASQGKGNLKLPSRNTKKKRIEEEASEI